MPRKYDVNDIRLVVTDWHPFHNEEYEGIVIEWESDLGWGQYQIYREVGAQGWSVDSEGMDSKDDRQFGEKLFSLILEGALGCQ